MNTARRDQLIAIGDAHARWVGAHLADASKAFDPDGTPRGGVYNQHHVDLDADGAAQDEFERELAGTKDQASRHPFPSISSPAVRLMLFARSLEGTEYVKRSGKLVKISRGAKGRFGDMIDGPELDAIIANPKPGDRERLKAHFGGMTLPQLRAEAKARGAYLGTSGGKEMMVGRLADHLIGHKLDSDAVRRGILGDESLLNDVPTVKPEAKARPGSVAKALLSGDTAALDGFNREQLRREAGKRGIALKRGASADAIKDALWDHERSGVDDEADLPVGEKAELDLARMTVPDLKARAKAEGVKGYSKMRKPELVAALAYIDASDGPNSLGGAGLPSAGTVAPSPDVVSASTAGGLPDAHGYRAALLAAPPDQRKQRLSNILASSGSLDARKKRSREIAEGMGIDTSQMRHLGDINRAILASVDEQDGRGRSDMPIDAPSAPAKPGRSAVNMFAVTAQLEAKRANPQSGDREAVDEILKPLTAAQLDQIALDNGWEGSVRGTKEQKRRLLAESLVGFKLDSNAIMARKQPSTAERDPVALRRSEKPLIKNMWGGGSSQSNPVAFHEDGAIGYARSRMGDDVHLEVDGDALGNVLGRIATDTVAGRVSAQEQIQRVRDVRAKVPEGSKAARELDSAISRMEAPNTPTPPVPPSAPVPLRELMDELHKVPIVRGADVGYHGKESETDKLGKILDEFAAGRTGGRRMIDEVQRLRNQRHESMEGKFEIDRAVDMAVARLREMEKEDRKSLYPPGQGGPDTPVQPSLTRDQAMIRQRMQLLRSSLQSPSSAESRRHTQEELDRLEALYPDLVSDRRRT